jgi:galactose mutarotase-like enzyme
VATGEIPETVTIAAGSTTAEFAPAANMVCSSLRVDGVELLHPTHGLEAYAERGKTMGIPLLHPWANRLGQPGYEVAGRTVQLPPPEGRYAMDPNGLPIHGALPGELAWDASRTRDDELRAHLRWNAPQLLQLFPFEHELEIEATVSPGTLSIATTIVATGADPVPVSFGFHPYLTPGAGHRDQWRVELGAEQRLVLDEHMIPTGQRTPLQPRELQLGSSSWDDGLAALDDPPVFAVTGRGRRLTVTFDEGFAWAQVYAPPGEDFICFEPMTAPTDALNSGDGLIVLAPGERHRTRFTVALAADGERWT